MPPKKKGKGKKGKKKKKDEGALELDDKYKKTVDEIEALKDHLAMRKEITRRSKTCASEFKTKITQVSKELDKEKEEHKDITADMTRQYKTMQSEMGLRITYLEKDLYEKTSALTSAEAQIKELQEEGEKMASEKDAIIQSLHLRISTMEKAYETILREAMDSLVEKIERSRLQWEDRSTSIQGKNKQTLMEFGLNPLDL